MGGGDGRGVLVVFAAGVVAVRGLTAGVDLTFGVALTAGVGFTLGVAFIAGEAEGDALGVGDAVGGAGFSTFTDDEATNFHSLFRLAKVSTKRYCPLTSTVLSGALIFPPLMFIVPVTTAASLSSIVTLRSLIWIKSVVMAPDSINFASSSLPDMLPSHESN